MSLRSCSTRLLVLAALVMAAACRSQAVAVNPNDPEMWPPWRRFSTRPWPQRRQPTPRERSPQRPRTTPLRSSPRTRCCWGTTKPSRRSARRMRCCKSKPIRSSRSAPACCPRTSSWCRRCGRARTPTRPVSHPRPWGSHRRPYSSAATGSGGSFTTINPLPR